MRCARDRRRPARLTRLLLHPIVCAFLLDRRTRRDSRRYLDRARSAGRAAWGDVYRHSSHFVATVLDRVYLLQERFDEFRFEASGVETILEPFAQRRRRARVRRPSRQLRGAAHDRPRQGPARGDDHVRGQRPPHQRGARRDRAEAPSCTRSRSAASTRCSRSGAGSTKAASPACSPTARCPGNSQRSKAVALPFLGAPALLPDGPFRLAAMLRRKVVFMAGLYRGGRTTICASSSSPTSAPWAAGSRCGRARRGHPRGAASATSRRSRRCAAKRPTTGSTSTTSGPMPTTRQPCAGRCALSARAAVARPSLACRRRCAVVAPQPGDRRRLRSRRAHRAARDASSRARRPSSRQRRIEMLDRTLDVVGAALVPGARQLRARDAEAAPREARRRGQHADDEHRRAQPHAAARRLARSGGDRRGDARHAHRQPRDARAAVRERASPAAPSTGRSSSCRATCACAARSLRCASPAARRSVREVQVLLADGDRSTMTIEPAAAARSAP